MTTIRRAAAEDVPQLVAMGIEFLTTSTYARHLAPCRAAIERTLAWMLAAPDTAAILVLDSTPLSIAGAIGLVRSTHLWTGEPYVGELFWWVTPAARGGGLRLLRAGERWAADGGALAMQMIAPTAQVGRVYERLGYAWLESGYHRRF